MSKIMDLSALVGVDVSKAARMQRHEEKCRHRESFDSRRGKSSDLPKSVRAEKRWSNDWEAEVSAWKEGNL